MPSLQLTRAFIAAIIAIVATQANAELSAQIDSVSAGQFHMDLTNTSGLRASDNVDKLVGATLDFVVTAGDVEAECPGLTCEKCPELDQDTEHCITCGSRFSTLTFTEDFIEGICGEYTVSDNKLVLEAPHLGCNTSEAPLEIPNRRVLKPKLWSSCTKSRRYTSVGFVVTERLVKEKFNDNLNHVKTHIVALLKQVNIIYENQLDITLEVGEIYYHKDSNRKPKPSCSTTKYNGGGQLSSILSGFTSWVGCVKQNHVAIWHLLDYDSSRLGSGLAYVGGVCSSRFKTGVSMYSSQHWRTVAHEIGHNFNALHPMQGKQIKTVNGGIMGYGDGKYDGEVQFDSGNKNRVCSFISDLEKRDDCPAFKSNKKETSCGNGILEKGEECECKKGTDCSCCKKCKLPKDAECSPNDEFPNCCTNKCKFAAISTTCDGGNGYCSRGACARPSSLLKVCSADAAKCRLELTDTNCKNGQKSFTAWFSQGKSLHIAKDNSICGNGKVCKSGECKSD